MRNLVVLISVAALLGGGQMALAQTEPVFIGPTMPHPDVIEPQNLLVEEAQQELADEPAAVSLLESIWFDNLTHIPLEPDEVIADRMACLNEQMHIELAFNRTVRGFVDYFTVRNRRYTEEMIRRRDVYFPLFEEALARHGMPDELKYLAIVESGLNPRARSRVGALGLWQFMPPTGRMYGLHRNHFQDERMDPYKSTEAACRYLKSLHQMFGDWHLALASYNCGPGNVRRAIRRSGHKQTFWDVYNHLPRETRSYVPQFVAVAYAMNYAEEHNILIAPDSMLAVIPHDTLRVDTYVCLHALSEELEVEVEALRFLNPELYRDAVAPVADGYVLRIPAHTKAFVEANRACVLAVAATPSTTAPKLTEGTSAALATAAPAQRKVTYRVRSGDALGTIARRHHVTVSQLRTWNNLRGSTIRVGQQLVIWKDSPSPTAVAQAKSAPATPKARTESGPVSGSSRQYHYVQPGDTLWDISRKYEGVSVQQLIKLNNLKGNSIKPGQKLIIS